MHTAILDALNGTAITTKQENVKNADVSTTENKEVKAPKVQKIQQNDKLNNIAGISLVGETSCIINILKYKTLKNGIANHTALMFK